MLTEKRNYIYGIATVLIWATMAAAVKSLLADIPDMEALSISSAFAFLFLLVKFVKKHFFYLTKRQKDVILMTAK